MEYPAVVERILAKAPEYPRLTPDELLVLDAFLVEQRGRRVTLSRLQRDPEYARLHHERERHIRFLRAVLAFNQKLAAAAPPPPASPGPALGSPPAVARPSPDPPALASPATRTPLEWAAAILGLKQAHPGISKTQAAKLLGCDLRHLHRVLRENASVLQAWESDVVDPRHRADKASGKMSGRTAATRRRAQEEEEQE